MRRRTVGQHDVVDEGFEVDLVVGESPHVALARIAQRALRPALPAPVDRRDREAARAQVAHGLEVFFDELGASLEQADGALAPGRRLPAGEAKLDPVAGLERAGRPPLRAPDWREYRPGSCRMNWEPMRGGPTPYSRARRLLNAHFGGTIRPRVHLGHSRNAASATPLAAHRDAPTSAVCRPVRAAQNPVRPSWVDLPHVAQGGYAMRTFDLAPLYRSTVGFDRLFSLFDQLGDKWLARLSALQYRADRRERLPHHASRWPALPSPSSTSRSRKTP